MSHTTVANQEAHKEHLQELIERNCQSVELDLTQGTLTFVDAFGRQMNLKATGESEVSYSHDIPEPGFGIKSLVSTIAGELMALGFPITQVYKTAFEFDPSDGAWGVAYFE